MFDRFYGLDGVPFSKGMPTSSLFATPNVLEGFERLLFVVRNRQFGVLTGECGCGKSTLLRKLNDSLEYMNQIIAYFADSKLSPRSLYNSLLASLGRDGSFYCGEARNKLHLELERRQKVGAPGLVVVVDEAHLLELDMLQESRFLLNYKMDSVTPLALILAGQPELDDKLALRYSAAIGQRVDVRIRLSHFGLAETAAYIEHHLRHVGAKTNIFLESAVKEIFVHTAGLARSINKICISCIFYGSSHKLETINDNVVREVVKTEFRS